jgi:hypothetical protein
MRLEEAEEMFRRYTQADDVTPLDDFRFTDPAIPAMSCCCPARPAVKVIMPPTASRPRPVDLWLCGHHYRASVGALLAAGAIVEDLTVTADRPQVEPAGAPA